ncbi:MAG: aldo/keto reductase [Chitinivibrionales bacterium]
MKYRRLGKTELKVPVVGIGTWQFGGEWGKDFTQQEVDEILSRSADEGIRFIDTAECYGDHLSESFIGKFLEGKRSDWIVATKFGHTFNRFQDRNQKWAAEDVKKQLEASLKALRTDYIDLYQFHSGTDEVFDQDDLWEMLNRQVQAGKIRYLGISIPSRTPSLHQVESATKVNASVIQVVYNRLDRRPEEKILPACQKQDLGVLARVPLASGYLSGKYKPGDTFPDNDVRSVRDKQNEQDKLRRVEHIMQTEVPEGVNMAQWALAWCLKHPAVTCVIPGCKNVGQVEKNAASSRLDMVSSDHPQTWRNS